jgi:uracil-DNA glycosylase family 4
MNKNKELSKLKKKILKFNKNFPNKNLVFAEGNKNSQVMIIGEAPGKTEDKLKKPFVGRAGKLLDELLNSIHLDRAKVYITNVINYRPDNNRKPTSNEINKFKKMLFEHIVIINPKYILLLGSTAAKAVLDHFGVLNLIRGKWRNIKILNYKFEVFTTFHPAFLLRHASKKKIVLNDFLKLKCRLKT